MPSVTGWSTPQTDTSPPRKRSVKEVLTIADDLHDKHIALQILTGTLSETYRPNGERKFFFTTMAAFAELERDMIRERMLAALATARAHGRVGGRPTVVTPDTLAAAKARQQCGETPTPSANRCSTTRHLFRRGVRSSEHCPPWHFEPWFIDRNQFTKKWALLS